MGGQSRPRLSSCWARCILQPRPLPSPCVTAGLLLKIMAGLAERWPWAVPLTRSVFILKFKILYYLFYHSLGNKKRKDRNLVCESVYDGF